MSRFSKYKKLLVNNLVNYFKKYLIIIVTTIFIIIIFVRFLYMKWTVIFLAWGKPDWNTDKSLNNLIMVSVRCRFKNTQTIFTFLFVTLGKLWAIQSRVYLFIYLFIFYLFIYLFVHLFIYWVIYFYLLCLVKVLISLLQL